MTTVLVLSVVNGATHHHSAPAPAPIYADCSTLIMNMVECLSYVSSGSNVTKPEGTCCTGLKTLLRTRAECLCEGLKSSSQMGIVLNVTKAAMLPAACSLSAPSVSNCGCKLHISTLKNQSFYSIFISNFYLFLDLDLLQ